ncbi:toxin-antitoxin system YwqK family antitoxin [Flavobacterium sp. UBA6135]|uniref:toxin-antitoxin system YwqK family antitoxin n=1 Tax=Flavobacterium sp. UBA6135 TaxID=1946553 RepID=UPI0025B90CB6|nr:hypothetical protein [Flavobacterium sp. UBA6135]
MFQKKFLPLLILCFLTVTQLFSQSEPNQLNAKGQKHGLWKGYYDDTKNLKYEGTFENGKEVGVFTFYDNTKTKRVVATREFDAKDNSAYTIFYKGKFKVSEGKVVNKLYEGEWKYYHLDMDQIMTLENYKNGKLDGVRKVFYKSGELAEETNYKEGKREGSYKKYAENGIVMEELNYKNDLFHGPAIYKETDGTISITGQYKNGLSVGEWKYYEKGKLVRTEKKELFRTKRPKEAANPDPTATKRKVKERKL